MEQGSNKSLEFIEEAMLVLREEGFTGYIKIEFQRGKIKKIEKFEEILKMKPDPEPPPHKKRRP